MGVDALNQTGETMTIRGDYFFSTMPVQGTGARRWSREVPANVREVSDGMIYRDFITVGLLADRLHGDGAGRRPAEGQLDLYSGAGCAARAAADLQ